MPEYATHLALVALLVLAVVWDLRTRRIPNALTIAGCFVALALRGGQGLEPFGLGVAGLLIGLGIAVPMVLAGGLGGGDAKLLAAVGAFLGPVELWPALLVMGMAGGLMAIAVALYRRRMYETLRHTWSLAGRLVGVVPKSTPRRTLGTVGALTIPYAIPIAIGAMASAFYL